MTVMKRNVLKQRVKTRCGRSCYFPFFLWHFSLQPCFEHEPSEEGVLSCLYLEPSARWWRQVACYRCLSLVIPFCTCFLQRETTGESGNWERRSLRQDGNKKETKRLSGEVISRCEALAGREDIIRVQGQADKERHIITSPYGPRLCDPIYLWGPLVTQAQWEICSFCVCSSCLQERRKPMGINSEPAWVIKS